MVYFFLFYRIVMIFALESAHNIYTHLTSLGIFY